MRKNVGMICDGFDPVNQKVLAHAILAQTALDLDEIWFLIPEDNAHDNFKAPFIYRHEMLKETIKDQTRAQILPVKDSDIYNNKELKRLHKEDKELNLFLIINGYQYQEITQLDKLKFLKWIDLILINNKNLDNINPDIKPHHIIEDNYFAQEANIEEGNFDGIPIEAQEIIIKNKLYLD